MLLQDDFVMGTLTVRENLFFSAALRLPSNISMRERRHRVQNIINELCLNNCSDRKVSHTYKQIVHKNNNLLYFYKI